MPLKVIGAGFGRTGTLSLKYALEQLGLGPCHHMMEVFGKPDHIALWQAAAEGKQVDWEEVFDGYNAAVDWPVCYFWKELAALYPDAKILLSRRDPDRWYDSASATIFKAMSAASDDPHRRMTNTLIVENTFGGNLADRDSAIAIYEKHNQAVINSIATERLLVCEAADGWGPLCNFLDIDVPETDYPRVNTTEDFRKRFETAKSTK